MKKQIYDDELLTQYLLGSLAEAETERLDELSFTDDKMAGRLHDVENDLVDAYVRGELSGQTLERFDSYYLSSPRRREKVAFARGLQSFMDRAAITRQAEKQQGALRGHPVTKSAASGGGVVRRYPFGRSPALQWGLAAAALLIVAVGWLVFENLRLRDQIIHVRAEREELQKREQELQSQLQRQQSSDSEKEEELASLRDEIARLEQQGAKSPPEITAGAKAISFVLAPQTRGVSQINPIRIPADADYVTLRLELEPNDFAFYRAELKAQSEGGVLWRSEKLKARARGDGKALVVNIRASLLKSLRYNLEVYGIPPIGAAELISNYPFKVEK